MNKLKAIFHILFSENYFIVTRKKDEIIYFFNANLPFLYDVSRAADEELNALIDMDDAANEAQQIIDNLN